MAQHSDPDIRRSQRVLAMVHELHKRGYQRLRIMPGLSPSGACWRVMITPASNILRTHGAMAKWFDDGLSVSYTSGADTEYFGWKDAKQDTARALAIKFFQRFPELVSAGKGIDREYAAWYVELLGAVEEGALPIAYAEYHEPPRGRLATVGRGDRTVSMPPPGEAEQ